MTDDQYHDLVRRLERIDFTLNRFELNIVGLDSDIKFLTASTERSFLAVEQRLARLEQP